MACYPFFLLAVLLFVVGVGDAVSDPTARRYQTLIATPLSPDPVGRNIPDTSSSLTHIDVCHNKSNASSAVREIELVVSSLEEAFAPPNTTASQLLAYRLERDAARSGWILAAIAPQGKKKTKKRSRGRRPPLAAPVVSGLSQGSGEYFVQVGVGTPPSPALLVLDTGSDLVWLQCAPCRWCYPQSSGHPVFDPRRSTSYASVDCASPICGRLDSDQSGCSAANMTCQYQVSYGDGSSSAGDLATETLSFGTSHARVAIGCGHDNQGRFVAAAGILGLGRGGLSFPNQIARRRYGGRSFSYCLVDRTSSASLNSSSSSSSSSSSIEHKKHTKHKKQKKQKKQNRTSTITFGGSLLSPAEGRRVTTVMVRNPLMETFYYVPLLGFSVGGARVNISQQSWRRNLRLNPTTGSGGVILDSGTSVTRLARPAYAALRDAFRTATTRLPLKHGGFSLFDTCYDLADRDAVEVPTLSMHFLAASRTGRTKGEEASVSLPPENILIPVDTNGTFCFAFAATDGGVSIIGNIQQQGFRLVFDGERQRVGFVPNSC